IRDTDIDVKFANCSATVPTPSLNLLCCMKNDSFKTDFLMEANGFDEDMDGTHGFQDSEMVRRLSRCHGAEFYAMNTMVSSLINVRYYLQARKSIKGYNN